MPRTEWLSLVREDVVDPDQMIIDPHHHLWPGTGHNQGGPYTLTEFQADVESGHNIAATVHIECYANYATEGPPEFLSVGETVYADSVGAEADRRSLRTHICKALVCNADLTLDNIDAVLDAHQAASPERLRGVRRLACWSPREPALFEVMPEYYNEPAFRRGFARLAPRGLGFDACLFHFQLPQLVSLARQFPETTIILDHIAMPLGRAIYEGRRRDALEELRPLIAEAATCPNIVIKLGGQNMWLSGQNWAERERPATSEELVAATGDTVHHAIDCFGPDRCMFESNFPPDANAASYRVTWNAHQRMAARYSAAERQSMFYGVADRIYRLGSPEPR